jgi:acylglycerol lipase
VTAATNLAEPAPAPDPDRPVAVASRPSLGTARMADGTTLRTLHWEPADDPWATTQIVHGLGEHGGRYQTVARAFTRAGIDTWSYDLRGNGGSGGPRGWVERWPILHDDLQERLQAMRRQDPERPLVLYGHSLGGLVALGYVLSEDARPLPDLLVLSAPGLDDNLAGWKRNLAGVLTNVVPRMKLKNGVPPGSASRDPGIDAASAADPLCSDSSTVRFGAEGFAEQDRVKAAIGAADGMPIPTYVLHGSADPLVPVWSSSILGGKRNVTRQVHEGLRHECHHEPEHEDVLAGVVAWIRANAGAAPGPSAGAATGADDRTGSADRTGAADLADATGV